MMMDHLSHLESLFGDESSQDELRRPTKGWSQLILEKQSEFEGVENDKDEGGGQKINKVGNGKHHPGKNFDIYGGGHSDENAGGQPFAWCQPERVNNDNQNPSDDYPSNDFEFAPLSPCFVRGDDGMVTTFTSADLPLTPHRFLSPRSSPYIPPNQVTIENVVSPVAGAIKTNWTINPSSHRHHHHHHHHKKTKHHHKHSSGKKKSSKHSQGVATATCSSSSSNGTQGVIAIGGKSSPSPFKIRRLTSILDSPEKHGTKMRRLSPYNYNLGSHIQDSSKKKSHRSRHRSSSLGNPIPTILEQRLLQSPKSPKKVKDSDDPFTPPSASVPVVFRTPEKPKRKHRSKIVSSPELSLIEELSPNKETVVPESPPIVDIEELDSPNKSPTLSPIVIRRSCGQAVMQILLSPASLAAKLQFSSSLQPSFAEEELTPLSLSGLLGLESSTPLPPAEPQPVSFEYESNDGATSQLSAKISEEQSTQEESNLVSLTPIGRWMHEDTEKQPMAVIEEEESEFPYDDSIPAHLKSDSEMWTVVEGRRRRKFNLCEEMATILRRYESSVRMFPHDLRSGKFQVDEDSCPRIDLIVRIIRPTDNKNGIWTICTDIKSGDHKAILFRGYAVNEMKIGCCLELYPPWKTLKMEEVPCEVIICADFYRIVSRSGTTLEESERKVLDAVLSTPVPKSLVESLITVPYTEALHNSFVNLLPDGARSWRSLTQQFMENCGRTEVALDEVELLKWTGDGKQVIVKDKNGSTCIVEVENDNNGVSKCLPESVITFEKLEVLKKIKENENPVLFSVLRVLLQNGGVSVPTVYVLKLGTSYCSDNLDIVTAKIHRGVYTSTSRILCDRKFIHEIRQLMEELEDTTVKRVCVLCLVTEVKEEGSSSKISIEDRLGYSMDIHYVGLGGDSNRFAVSDGSYVALDFLRVSGGELPTFDEFSVVLPPSSYEIS